MREYRPDRVVRVLTTVVSVAYFVFLAGGVAALVTAPAVRLFAGGHSNWEWGLKVPTTVVDTEATVRTAWGAARLVVDEARADLHLPIATLPWWLVAVLWTHAAVAIVLVLLCLHHLRRIFQRVRDGSPFDAQNALRLRWLGLLLLALALFKGFAELATALAVKNRLLGGDVVVVTGLRVDAPVVFIALVLVALAEIFRRGAELEDEQALVI
jgi:hypothetical protein